MSLFDGFPFTSKQQQDAEAADFEQRVLPLGEGQRQAALGVLRQLMPRKKTRDTERLYAYLSCKNTYTGAANAGEGRLLAEKALQKQQVAVTAEEAALVLALAELDLAIGSLEEYPTAAAVTAHAQKQT